MNVSATIMNVSSRRSAAFSQRCARVDDIRMCWKLPRRSQRRVDELTADALAELVPYGAHRRLPRLELLGRQHGYRRAAGIDDALLVFLVDRFGARVTPLRRLCERRLEPVAHVGGQRLPER